MTTLSPELFIACFKHSLNRKGIVSYIATMIKLFMLMSMSNSSSQLVDILPHTPCTEANLEM